MAWFWLSMGTLGGLYYLYVKGRRASMRKTGRPSAGDTTSPAISPEQVEAALASGDVKKMIAILKETGDPLRRHALFTRIVTGYYQQRTEPNSKAAFYDYAGYHIQEISLVLKALDQLGKERPEQVETFRMLAIALCEDERFDEAIDICKRALSLGLEDGTKTGFKGRIARLEKRKNASAE